jgi:hypothetical protein
MPTIPITWIRFWRLLHASDLVVSLDTSDTITNKCLQRPNEAVANAASEALATLFGARVRARR